VILLMEQEPSSLHAKDTLGARPLHYCESPTVAEHLVSLGADIDALDSSGQSALCYAVTKQLHAVVRLLCKLKATTNMCVRSHNNPLHIAIRNATYEIATTLIAFGASVNKLDHLGNTPLHVAARKSPRNFLELLLDNGANALILNDRGLSALHVAAQFDNYDAIDILSCNKPDLIIGCDVKMTSSGTQVRQTISQSPLYICVEKFNTRAVNLMLPRLPMLDAEFKDSTGRNILHYAAEAGNLYLVEGLIGKKVDLNAPKIGGDTALILAIRSRLGLNRLKLCQVLIEHGASVTAQNDVGEMVWDIAVDNIDVETQDDLRCILELLLLHSNEACRMVTRRIRPVRFLPLGRTREPCGQDLVHFAFNRPDIKLLKALKTRMPSIEFEEAEGEEKRMKEEKEKAERERAERERAARQRLAAEETRAARERHKARKRLMGTSFLF
jgi:ankyrin repeat protein